MCQIMQILELGTTHSHCVMKLKRVDKFKYLQSTEEAFFVYVALIWRPWMKKQGFKNWNMRGSFTDATNSDLVPYSITYFNVWYKLNYIAFNLRSINHVHIDVKHASWLSWLIDLSPCETPAKNYTFQELLFSMVTFLHSKCDQV